MADAVADDIDLDAEALGDGDELAPSKKKLSGKKLVLFVILPTVALVGFLAVAYIIGLFDSFLGAEQEQAEEVVEAPKKVSFFDLQEMVVNLNSSGKQPSYLKISVSLEIDDPLLKPQLEALMPRIIDQFQVYLRELRKEDLSGSAGLYRLKEELLMRVNAAVHPIKINDVLFKEFIVQ
jgi:flagellar FliL protein